MLPSGMGVALPDGAGEAGGCAFMSGIGVGMAGSGSGMVPSGSGVGLADGWDFVALWRGEGGAAVGIEGRAAGVG